MKRASVVLLCLLCLLCLVGAACEDDGPTGGPDSAGTGSTASTDAGLDADVDATTATDSGSAATYDCVLEGVACFIAVPVCAQGEVPSVEGSCYGPCVPIEQCRCDGPEDCPDSAHYTCFNHAHHCGPYTL
jgi:hypothetical protein